jgi:hypothetical protein
VDKFWMPPKVNPAYSPEVQQGIRNFADANREDLINVCVHTKEYE